MELIYALRNLGETVERDLPDLNRGGCAVYAARVAAALTALGVKCWGVVGTECGKDLETVRNEHKCRTRADWNRHGFWFDHVLVRFEYAGQVWTHDSRDTVPGEVSYEWTCGTPIVPGRLSVPELNRLARCTGWNPTFDRRDGIPWIRRRVADFLASNRRVSA